MKAHAYSEPRFVSEIAILVCVGDDLAATLRGESCLPSSALDAQKVSRIIEGVRSSRIEDRILRLTRVSTDPERSSAERWRTLGCRLLDERHPLARAPGDAELAQVARRAIANRNLLTTTPAAVRIT